MTGIIAGVDTGINGDGVTEGSGGIKAATGGDANVDGEYACESAEPSSDDPPHEARKTASRSAHRRKSIMKSPTIKFQLKN